MGWAARANPCAHEGAKSPAEVDLARLRRVAEKLNLRDPETFESFIEGWPEDKRADIRRIMTPLVEEA